MSQIEQIVEQMRKAAEAATPGPWEYSRWTDGDVYRVGPHPHPMLNICEDVTEERDARHIAASNPANVLAILAALKEAQEGKERERDECANFVFDALAKALGLKAWTPEDGSETWDGDVRATLYRLLRDSGAIDEDTHEPAHVRLAALRADRHALAAERDALLKEGAALAANQCHDGYGDEWGNHCCRRVDAAVAECETLADAATKATARCDALAAALKEAGEALEKAQDAISSAYLQAQAEYQGHDIRAGKLDRDVMASRAAIRAALASIKAMLTPPSRTADPAAP